MSDWERDCMEMRGRVLTGPHAHWCVNWDDLPIDATCDEWPCGCNVSQSAERVARAAHDAVAAAFGGPAWVDLDSEARAKALETAGERLEAGWVIDDDPASNMFTAVVRAAANALAHAAKGDA